MKALIGIFFFSTALLVDAQSIELDGARKAFHKAVMDEAESQSFHTYMLEIENPTPVVAAYQAVSEAMLARVLWNPFSKLAQVRKYQEEMENAVAEDPQDIEIRFLRLAIEFNLPAFLGMSEHVEEDVDMILSNMASASALDLDPSYGQYIFYFLESSDLCSTDQIMAMRNSLAQSSAY